MAQISSLRILLSILLFEAIVQAQEAKLLRPLACEEESMVRSRPEGTDGSIDFVNGTGDIIQVFKLDENGRRRLYRKLRPQYSYQDHTEPAEYWVVADGSGGCLGIYRAEAGANRVRLGTKPIISRRGIPPYILRTTVLDGRSLRSDGKGEYIHGKDAISTTLCDALNLWLDSLLVKGRSIRPCAMPSHQPEHTRLRSLRYDLSRPVQESGAKDTGEIEDFDSGVNVFWRHDHDAHLVHSIQAIPPGETSESERVQFMLHIGGVRHTLHVGSWVPGEFVPTQGPIHGEGTSAARVTRVTETEWLVDGPEGTLARLWSRADPKKPKDMGLFRFSFKIRFELLPDMSQKVP